MQATSVTCIDIFVTYILAFFLFNCFPLILPSISQFNPCFNRFFITSIVLCMKIKHYFLLIATPPPPPQGVVPAAEPAHGRPAGLHLRRAAGPQPRRRLDGPGHALRVLQPAARRHQVLHQRHTQQGLHQHHGADPPHQMPAGGWREDVKAGGGVWMQLKLDLFHQSWHFAHKHTHCQRGYH